MANVGVEDFRKLSPRNTSSKINAIAKDDMQKGHYMTALPLFELATELGLVEASFNLGVCYELALGVHQDFDKVIVKYLFWNSRTYTTL